MSEASQSDVWRNTERLGVAAHTVSPQAGDSSVDICLKDNNPNVDQPYSLAASWSTSLAVARIKIGQLANPGDFFAIREGNGALWVPNDGGGALNDFPLDFLGPPTPSIISPTPSIIAEEKPQFIHQDTIAEVEEMAPGTKLEFARQMNQIAAKVKRPVDQGHDIPFDRDGRCAFIITDIATSQLVVTTSGIAMPNGKKIPVLVKRATFDQFLAHAIKMGWVEVAPDHMLNLSHRGRHVVYLKKSEEGVNELLSNALLQLIDIENENNDNLCLNPFFTDGWDAEVNREDIVEAFNDYADSRGEGLVSLLQRYDMKLKQIPEKKGPLRPLIVGLVRCVGPQNIEEIIRYSFDEAAIKKEKRLLYDSMTATTGAAQKEFWHAIFEAPIIRRLDQIQRKTGRICYKLLAKRDIKDETTYNTLLFPRNIADGGRELAQEPLRPLLMN